MAVTIEMWHMAIFWERRDIAIIMERGEWLY